ncbi:MAG: hypothetical protein K0Q72_666 [Armatimonadetes bacterium]|jgi:hypothetical protein|nr:hypothetical protein [Armatimonadota bacterium]
MMEHQPLENGEMTEFEVPGVHSYGAGVARVAPVAVQDDLEPAPRGAIWELFQQLFR